MNFVDLFCCCNIEAVWTKRGKRGKDEKRKEKRKKEKKRKRGKGEKLC